MLDGEKKKRERIAFSVPLCLCGEIPSLCLGGEGHSQSGRYNIGDERYVLSDFNLS
jgi:hypothetical protein